MKILLPLALFVCCLFTAHFSQGQNVPEKKVTIKLDSARFDQFVKQVEAQTGYYFYYDPAKFDSLTLDLNVNNLSVREALDQVFRGSEFDYSIDSQKRIYITQGQKIITQLMPGLFNPERGESDSVAYAGPDDDAKEKLLSTAESKVHEIGVRKYRITPGNSTITGYVRNAVTGEPVIGAAVFITSPSIGVTTDALGQYALTIPRGKQVVRIRSTGMRETQRQVILYSDGKLDIEMREIGRAHV